MLEHDFCSQLFFIVKLSLLLLLLLRESHADCSYRIDYLQPTFPTNNTFNDEEENYPTISAQDYFIIEDTYACFKNFEEQCNLYNNTSNDAISYCEDGDLDISFYSHSVLPNGTNILPYVKLNISLIAFEPVQRLFVQFRCIHAPDLEDKYCHDHSSQIKRWGRMIWPCRELKLNTSSANASMADLSLRFSYNCFNLFGFSQYEVNVTILPKFCRSTFLLTIPGHRQLEPNIRNFYLRSSDSKHSFRDGDWSPLVFADMSLPDGVWIRFQPSLDFYHQPNNMIVKIFGHHQHNNNGGSRLLHTESLPYGQSGFKWENVPAGEYFVLVYADRFDCRLSCNDGDENASSNNNVNAGGQVPGCRICPYTSLNFTILHDKFTEVYSRKSKAITVAKVFVVAVFVTLTLLIVALLLALFYLRVWRPRQLARHPAQSIELKERPSVLIIYTDDCEAHADVVHSLTNLLVENANAHVYFDQFALQDPTVRPSLWLLNAISESQFVLIIFSACSRRVLSGEKLRQRRPFADLFISAIDYVIAKINAITQPANNSTNNEIKRDIKTRLGQALNAEQSLPFFSSLNSTRQAALSRFIVSRFSYSPTSVVPEFFDREHFGRLCLPEDLGLLVGRLHGLLSSFDEDIASARNRFECSANTDELDAKINAYKSFVQNNPNWIEERFEKESGEDHEPYRLNECLEQLVSSTLSNETNKILTVDEQIKVGEKYGLKLPFNLNNDSEDEADNWNDRLQNEKDSLREEVQNEFEAASKSPQRKFELIGNVEDFHASSSSSISSED